MQKSDFTETQLEDLNLFNLILECAGWDEPNNNEKRLNEGEEVNPEGYRLAFNPRARLESKFHVPVNMVSLKIMDLMCKEHVLFHFLYDNHPERILEWLAAHTDNLCLENYPEILKQASGKCEMILLEVSETEIYEVKPPSKEESGVR